MTEASQLPLAISAEDLSRQRLARLQKARQLRWRHRVRRLVRACIATVTIAVIALGAAILTGGMGIEGALLTLIVMTVVFVLFALFPRTSSLRAAKVAEWDLPLLAEQTQGWLEARRQRLPANSQVVIDLLASRLEELSPRLGSLREDDPAALGLRRLLREDLPSLVNSYTSIPAALTRQPHAGSTPAAQLHAGLETVAREVETIGKQVASGEMDALAIRSRYLDARYDVAGPGEQN